MVALINTALMRTVVAAGRLRRRFTEERGQDMLEYALLGGLIAAAIVGAATAGIMTGVLTGMADGIKNCVDFNNGVGSECDPFP